MASIFLRFSERIRRRGLWRGRPWPGWKSNYSSRSAISRPRSRTALKRPMYSSMRLSLGSVRKQRQCAQNTTCRVEGRTYVVCNGWPSSLCTLIKNSRNHFTRSTSLNCLASSLVSQCHLANLCEARMPPLPVCSTKSIRRKNQGTWTASAVGLCKLWDQLVRRDHPSPTSL